MYVGMSILQYCYHMVQTEGFTLYHWIDHTVVLKYHTTIITLIELTKLLKFKFSTSPIANPWGKHGNTASNAVCLCKGATNSFQKVKIKDGGPGSGIINKQHPQNAKCFRLLRAGDERNSFQGEIDDLPTFISLFISDG